MENSRYKNASIIVVELSKDELGLYERESGLLLDEVFSNLNDAVEYARFINNGGGFNGFTPLFMLKNTGIEIDGKDEKEEECFQEECDSESIAEQVVPETNHSKQKEVQ